MIQVEKFWNPYKKHQPSPLVDGTFFCNPLRGGDAGNCFYLIDHPAMHASIKDLGLLIVDIEGNRLQVQFINEKNEIRDYLTIIKEIYPAFITSH